VGRGDSAGAGIVSHVVDRQVADWVRREALAAVVSRGTGKKAAVSGYEIFGKTGTAQKLDPQTGEYSRELHVSSFVCGAPVDDPRVLVMISVDEPSVSLNGEHFGGSVAAPAAGELLHHALVRLKVPTDESLIRSALLPDDFGEQFLE
jgi:cell division protein FtsI/penicillin-binding protein 2